MKKANKTSKLHIVKVTSKTYFEHEDTSYDFPLFLAILDIHDVPLLYQMLITNNLLLEINNKEVIFNSHKKEERAWLKDKTIVCSYEVLNIDEEYNFIVTLAKKDEEIISPKDFELVKKQQMNIFCKFLETKQQIEKIEREAKMLEQERKKLEEIIAKFGEIQIYRIWNEIYKIETDYCDDASRVTNIQAINLDSVID